MAYGVINADLMTTSDGVSSAGTYGMKSRIINGAMVIDQRNAGASSTPSGTGATYYVDRFYYYASQASKFTMGQNLNSVTPPAGFSNYYGLQVASAVSIGSSDRFLISQGIEAYNISDLNWGTANAVTVTLSFWVRSSLTGTFGGVLTCGQATLSYPFTYTINSANTWEQKTITIAGPTSGGTWTANNQGGLYVQWGLGVGSTYSGSAGSWTANNYNSATGGTSVVGTSGATFYITGVQLEKGSTATSFDYRPYSAELAMCQRYYWKSLANNNVNQLCWASLTNQNSSTRLYGFFQYPVTMRTTPSSISTNSISVALYYGSSGTNITSASIDGSTIGQNTAAIIFDTASSPATAGQVLILTSQGGGAGYVAFNAEL